MQSGIKENEIIIDSFDKLLKVCAQKKEIKLKYELEKNVNLVNFEKNRIEISFNDNLEKNFVKDLSIKLLSGQMKDGLSLLVKLKVIYQLKKEK